MENKEELEQEGKLLVFMDETPSRPADSRTVTVNHGEYIVEVNWHAQWIDRAYGLRIQEWQHTGEDEGEYVEIYYHPCCYDKQFVNAFGTDDELSLIHI